MSTEAQTAAASPTVSGVRAGLFAGRPWAAVILLMLLTVVNYLDRILPGILAEPLKQDLGLSDTFLGVLNGIAFLAVYAVAGIPIARFADRGRYGLVISAALAIWSAMTALGGFVGTGWQLALTRMGVAVGEAGSTPAAHAYISRNFAPERRAAALAVFTLGAPLGGMCGLIAGGLIGEALGWRMTFLAMGALGLVLAPLVLLALGPGRPIEAPAARSEGGDLLAILRKPSVWAILGATSFISMAGYSSMAFAPAFLQRLHQLSIGTIGLQMGLLQGASGAIGLLLSGWIGGLLSKRDPRWMLAVLAVMTIACAPVGVAAYTVGDAGLAVILVAVSTTVVTAYLGLTVACLHSVTPAPMRARASAVLLFCSAMFGSLGPLIVGRISDVLHDALGAASLARAMLIVPVAFVLATLCYLAAMATFARDQERDAA